MSVSGWGNLGGIRVIHDRIEDLLDTLVLEGGAAVGQEERKVDRALTDAPLEGLEV